MTESGAALQVEHVGKNFGGLQVLQDVTLRIAAGERRAIIGPNGAGKTTLFNLITGELPVSRGQILMFGDDVTRLPVHRRARQGMARTFQRNNLFLNLPVLDNLTIALQRTQGVQRSWFRPRTPAAFPELYREAHALLEMWHLEERTHVPVRELSYGEQREIEIVLGLAAGPRVLLLDEPTAGVSAAETEEILRLLRRIPPETTLLIIEHDMELVFGLADRISVLYSGRVLAEGTPEQIRADAGVREAYLGTAGDA